MQTEYERFSNLVQKQECWEWMGTTYRGNYGHFRRKIDGIWKMYKAHRYSYEYFNGPIPNGLIIRHSCDNPKCVNPAHLLVGTHKENSQDMIKRGRKGYGVGPNSKRHDNLVTDIRKYKVDNPSIKGVELASIFKTSPAQISRILNNQIWYSPEEL